MHLFLNRRLASPSPRRMTWLSGLIGTFLFGASLGVSGTHAAAAMNVASAQRAKEAGCDYYIITDASFQAQALRLAKIRRDFTPAVAAQPCIALMADIYKSHPPRGPKWTSVQDFLKAAYAENQATLSHVVLLGDASFDGNSAHNHVPVFTQQIRSLTRYSPDTLYYDTLTSDDAYSAFFDSVDSANGKKHFPLAGLGDVALRPVRAGVKAKDGYRLVLRGAGLVLEGQGRRIGLDGRAMR